MRHSQHLTFQELELRRQELVQRRKLVEQKLLEQGKLFHELQQSQKESQIRLIQRYQEQNNQARKRNQSYLEEIALVSSTAQLQKDLVKIKHQSTSSSYNPRAPTSSASYLLQAKKNYESHFENLLPSYYREQTHQMEEEYKKLQLTKLQSKHRHERLKQELIREQEMKARLYQQKQELLQILTLEQKDLMESKIHHLLLQEENQLITQELQQYLANEGYRLEAQVKQELEQFQPEDVLSLPKATSSNNLIDKHVSQRGKLGSLLPPPPAIDRVANEMMSLPAQHLDQPLPISQKKNDSSSDLAELKRNAFIAMREAQVQQMSADTTMKRSLTRDSSILSQSNNTSQYNNLTVAGEEHLPPHQNTQPQFLPSQTSEAKSVVPATLSALSQENFFAVSGSNTTSRNPSPSHKRGAPIAESLDDFPTITAATADAKEVVIKASDSNVINTTADPSANTSGSDEFDVLSEKYSSANQASLPFPEQTSVAEPASAKSLNKTSSSKPTSMEKFEFFSEGGKKAESAIVTSNKSAKERKTDINTMGVDIVNKILNKCYQFVEGQLSSLTSLRHIYDWFDGIPTNPTLNLVQQLYDQIDKITSDFWEGEGISKTNNSLKIAGEVVLYIVAEKGSLLIPSHVVEGVVTMDKLRRELKKTNGLLLLWDNLINHLKIIVSVKPSWLEGVTSCFTSALVKHVSASSGDDENYERMKRKIHKLLQLGVIPEDVESPTNPNSAPSPYRRTSAAPTVFSVTDSNWAPTSTNMVVEAEEASALTFNIGKRKSIPSTAPVSSNPLALNNSVMAPILNKSEISRVAELELDEIEEDESFEKPPAIKDLDREQRSMITPQASVSNAHRSKSVNVSSNAKMSRNNDVDEFDF